MREPVGIPASPERRRVVAQPVISFSRAMLDPHLFAAWFAGPSWATRRVISKAEDGEGGSLTAEEASLFAEIAGGRIPPTVAPREVWEFGGRRGAKSLGRAARAAHAATCVDYRPYLKPGETPTVVVIASDRDQASITFKYIEAFLDTPLLKPMVRSKTKDSIELTNGVVIQVQTASFRHLRGRTVCCAILEEVCFWFDDATSANPASEIIAALRPSMATIPTARLFVVTTPYRRSGIAWETFRRFFGINDLNVLVLQAPTKVLNPTIDQTFLDAEYEKDATSARSEYGAEWRSDLEDFVDVETVERAVIQDRRELPPALGRWRYAGFIDPSGGSSDSMTLAIAHNENGRVVLDHLSEVRPPFSPEAVVEQFAAILARWNLRKATSDRWGGSWPVEQFKKRGITIEPSEKTKSDIYAAFLPMLNSHVVELLDDRRLTAQLLGLERRTAWGGRDSIDHRPGAHDDVINAAAGALVLVGATRPRPLVYIPDGIARIGEPAPARIGIVGQAPLANRGEVGGQARFVTGAYTPRWLR
jgi:hypothetical protein